MTHSRTVEVITSETALAAVKAALEESQQLGAPISVAVYSPLLTLVAFAQGDGAPTHSIETSQRKARTSASTRRSSGYLPDSLAIALPLASGNQLTNLGGGLPIKFGTVHVGGIGIGGGTVEQDIAIAKAALEAIGADPVD
jgi:glc operon protein GlcG